MWKADKVWQAVSEVSRLSCGLSPRMSGPLSSSLHSYSDRNTCQDWRGRTCGGHPCVMASLAFSKLNVSFYPKIVFPTNDEEKWSNLNLQPSPAWVYLVTFLHQTFLPSFHPLPSSLLILPPSLSFSPSFFLPPPSFPPLLFLPLHILFLFYKIQTYTEVERLRYLTPGSYLSTSVITSSCPISIYQYPHVLLLALSSELSWNKYQPSCNFICECTSSYVRGIPY